MNGNEKTIELNFEAEIIDRIDDLIASKKRENEKTIGRLNNLETSWKDVNADLDKELSGEIDLLSDEEEAIDKAKKRLRRNPFAEIDVNTFRIAGRVEEIDSKIGLPGLTVKILIGSTEKEVEAKTDSYGNFFAEIPIMQLKSLVFAVFLKSDTLIHKEEIRLITKAGTVKEVTLSIKFNEKLADSLAFGKLVKESIESDEELLKLRTTNMKEAYKAYGRLKETTFSHMKMLKDELTLSPPNVVISPPTTEEPVAAEIEEKTRYLGNSNTREVHDLKKEKKNCRIDNIKFDHRMNFKTRKEAVEAGYDHCAYCFGKGKSKR